MTPHSPIEAVAMEMLGVIVREHRRKHSLL